MQEPCQAGAKLKQIGVRAGTLKSNGMCRFVNFIDKNPVTLNMAVTRSFPFSVSRMITIFRRKRFFIYDHFYNIMEFTQIPALFLHQLELLLERFLKMKIKHSVTADGRLIVGRFVRILPIQKVLPYFFKFVRFMPFHRNLPARNSHTFLNGGDSFGIVARISGYGVDVRGTDGARVRMDVLAGSSFRRQVCRSRSKGNNSPARRNFAWNFDCQPVTGRYFNSLFYGHKVHYTALKNIKQGVCLRFAETSINITAHAVKSKE